MPDPSKRVVALGVEYDGSSYCGWQRQLGQPTVQAALESALSAIANEPVRTVASGRTDAGVHATSQVVSFATAARRTPDAWIRGTNSLTEASLAVHWAAHVPGHFHARYSATARRYHYVTVESQTRPTLLDRRVTWSRARLDDRAMHRAGQALIGEHDFTTFRAASCQSATPYRCMHMLAVRRFAEFVVMDLVANAFLHHMVRNIASALLAVGRGERDEDWVGKALLARDRGRIGATAPPAGLYLVEVRYGGELELPGFRPPPMLGALGDIW
jgi:tRNA pseudouridine38-40 synthase